MAKPLEAPVEDPKFIRSRDIIVRVVTARWTNKPYALIERAGDAAIKALREGKNLSESLAVAQDIVERG